MPTPPVVFDLESAIDLLVQQNLRNIGDSPDELALTEAYAPRAINLISTIPPQGGQILLALVYAGKPLSPKEISDETGIKDTSVSTLASRIMGGSYIVRGTERPTVYTLDTTGENVHITNYLIAHYTQFYDIWRSQWSQELIPDRQNPITYFRKHQNEVVAQYRKNTGQPSDRVRRIQRYGASIPKVPKVETTR